jgi:hypothetical protein
MRLNFLSFSNLTLLVALALSTVAEFYSIMGLTAIFAGAVIPVVIMGVTLGVAKITTTVWLRKYWHRAGWVIKLYLVPAVFALAMLTSMGIFGFLSKAHMENGVTSGDAQAKVAIYDEKIKTAKDNIDANRKALKQLDDAVDQVMGRSTSEQGADKAVQIRRSQANDRKRLLAEIQDEQKTISKLSEERAPLASELRKVEAEVGPIKYIAALIYGDNADGNMLEAAVRWVIILLVAVFDPLAIALVLAGNQSKEWDNEEDKYEHNDGTLTEDQLSQIENSVNDAIPDIDEGNRLIDEIEKEVPEVILPKEPFKFVDYGEHPKDYDETHVEEPVIEVKEEKSIFEQHPYLLAGFDHFKNTQPLVYRPEVNSGVKENEAGEIVLEKKSKKKAPMMSVAQKKTQKKPNTDKPSAELIDNAMTVLPAKPYEELEGGYVMFEGRHMQYDVLKNLRPDLFMLNAAHTRAVNTNFGTVFPATSEKGDIFVRVDAMPNRVYKFDGNKWIEVDKEKSDTYLYNDKYIQHLIEKLDIGQYDPELLSDGEREQIGLYIKHNQTP